MVDFDDLLVVDIVRAGLAPSAWNLFRAQRRYFYATGIGCIALAIVCLGGTALFANVYLATQDIGTAYFSFFLGLFGLGIAARAIYLLDQLRVADEQWLAVTPEGVVDYRGQKRGVASAIAFQRLDSMSLRMTPSRRSRSTSLSLDLMYKVRPEQALSRSVVWFINSRFSRQEAVAQAIVEAYTRYVARMTPVAESHF